MSKRTREQQLRRYSRPEPITASTLALLRRSRITTQGLTLDTRFTCDTCDHRLRCTVVFEDVNVGGKCLLGSER